MIGTGVDENDSTQSATTSGDDLSTIATNACLSS
jgi:hypothetical protein